MILAINIYERDCGMSKNIAPKGFFNNCKINGDSIELNLDIWNNQTVHQMTGYSIDDIKTCLIELSQFICNNLSPNRLEGFDLSAISTTQRYSL